MNLNICNIGVRGCGCPVETSAEGEALTEAASETRYKIFYMQNRPSTVISGLSRFSNSVIAFQLKMKPDRAP